MIIKRQSRYNLLFESLKDAKIYIENQVSPKERNLAQKKLIILNDLITNDRKGKGNTFFVPLLKMMILDNLNKEEINGIIGETIDKLDFKDIPDNMKEGATQHPQFIFNIFNKAIKIREAVKKSENTGEKLDSDFKAYKGKLITEIIVDILGPIRKKSLVNRLIAVIPFSTTFLKSPKGASYKGRASIREEVQEAIKISPDGLEEPVALALSQLRDFKLGVKKIGKDLEERSANYYMMTKRLDPASIRNFIISLIIKYSYTKEEREEIVKKLGGLKINLLYRDDRFSVFGVRHHSVFLPYDPIKGDKTQGICFNAAWCVSAEGQFLHYSKNAIQIVIYDYGLLLSDGSTNFLDPMFQFAFHIDKDYKFTDPNAAIQGQDEGNIPSKVNNRKGILGSWERAHAAFGGKFETNLGLDAFKKIGLPVEEIKRVVDYEFLIRGVTDLFLYSKDKSKKEKILSSIGGLIRLPQKMEVIPSYDKAINKITFADLGEFADIAKSLIDESIGKENIKNSVMEIIKANGGLCIGIQMELLDKLDLKFTKEDYEKILNISKTSSELFSKPERKGFGASSKRIQKAGSRMSPDSEGFKNLVVYLEEKLGIREKKKTNPLELIESLVKMGQNEKDKLMRFFSLIFSKHFNEGEFTLDNLEEFAKTRLKVVMSPVTPELFIDAMENYPEGVGIIATYHIDALDSLNVVLDSDKYKKIQQEMTENIKMIRDDLSQGLAEFEVSYDVISKNYHLAVEKLRAKSL